MRSLQRPCHDRACPTGVVVVSIAGLHCRHEASGRNTDLESAVTDNLIARAQNLLAVDQVIQP
jgi:hypothetical protein